MIEKTAHQDEDTQITITYGYDKAGNSTSMTEGEETVTYSYNGLDQLIQMIEGDSAETKARKFGHYNTLRLLFEK